MNVSNNSSLYGLELDVLERIRKVFSSFPEIEQAILYGSRAKGNYRPGSDIDLTFKGDLSLQVLNSIANQLDDLLLPYQFDLSIYHKIDSESLLDHINRVGIVLYYKEP